MAESVRANISRVLDALADLAPSAEQRSTSLVIPTEWFRWLPLAAVRLFLPGAEPLVPGVEAIRRLVVANDQGIREVPIDRRFGERLAALDQLRPTQRSLRAGWLFVAGRVMADDGRARRVFHPLVTVPVRVDRIGGTRLVPAGDVQVSELVSDRAVRDRLEGQIELGGGALDGSMSPEVDPALLARLGRLQRFARSAASGADMAAEVLVPAAEGPEQLLRAEGLVIVAGAAVYAMHETGGTSRAGSLRAWSATPLATTTAFHRLYLDGADAAPPPGVPVESVDSPLLLTPVQRDAVVRSRSEGVTLISGAPGTGKSHTIAAIACDALTRGQTVLVAAKSDATVDALLDLLERSPGPDPVVFGSNERREALAARLSAGQLQPATDTAVSVSRPGPWPRRRRGARSSMARSPTGSERSSSWPLPTTRPIGAGRRPRACSTRVPTWPPRLRSPKRPRQMSPAGGPDGGGGEPHASCAVLRRPRRSRPPKSSQPWWTWPARAASAPSWRPRVGWRWASCGSGCARPTTGPGPPSVAGWRSTTGRHGA